MFNMQEVLNDRLAVLNGEKRPLSTLSNPGVHLRYTDPEQIKKSLIDSGILTPSGDFKKLNIIPH